MITSMQILLESERRRADDLDERLVRACERIGELKGTIDSILKYVPEPQRSRAADVVADNSWREQEVEDAQDTTPRRGG